MVIRLFVLQAHYRKPLDFTEEAILSATNGWQTLQQGLLFWEKYGNRLGWKKNQEIDSTVIEQFKAAMDGDFNSPGGLAVLFDLAKNLRREGNLLTHGVFSLSRTHVKEYLAHRLLNEGELIIKWGRKLKNKGNAVIAV